MEADPRRGISERIDSLLDDAAGFSGGEHALGINQVLINEYEPGQGIAVSVVFPVSCLLAEQVVLTLPVNPQLASSSSTYLGRVAMCHRAFLSILSHELRWLPQELTPAP